MFNNKSLNKTELQINISDLLKSHNIPNYELESQILIAHSAKEEKFVNVDFHKIDYSKLENMISIRIEGVPLAKIINQKGFWKNIFYTNNN